MKKESTIQVKGKSGQKYVFHTYSLPARLTAVGGAFMYLKILKGGDYKVLNIGTTHDFLHEMKNTDFQKKIGATHITAIQKNGKPKRDAIARDIQYLKR